MLLPSALISILSSRLKTVICCNLCGHRLANDHFTMHAVMFPTVDCFWMANMALWICWFLVMFIVVSKGGLIAPFLDLGHCCRCVELPAER